MSKTTNRDKAPLGAGSVDDRLARLLDAPFLARVVPHLPAETLHQLIRHRGLDACAELVTLATPAQLTSLVDLDLWRPERPGRDGQFDVERFGEWLEVLVDTGDSVAARTVAALDEKIVVAGLSRYMRVFDPGIFEPTAQSDDEALERYEAMRDGDVLDVGGQSEEEAPAVDPEIQRLECEIGGYIIRARRVDAWDAIVALLITLDAEHSDCFHAVMKGCRRLSNSRSEVDGLDDLLRAPEQHLHEVSIERERRRTQQGYATPADARAFLATARKPRQSSSGVAGGSSSVNPIVRAYFRAVDEPTESTSSSSSSSSSSISRASRGGGEAREVSESIDAVVELLAEAGMMPERPRALLMAADEDPQPTKLSRLRQLMEYVHDTDAGVYFARNRELAFLANVLLAGCSVQARAFTTREASDAAAAVCNLGFEYWPAGWPDVPRDAPLPESLLVERDLVTAFEVGWSVLYQDVSLFAARQLISILDDLRSVDLDMQREFFALRRKLGQQCEAGTPWLARGAAEALAMLDATAWVSVVGLLDECPILPAALTAILEGRTSGVSATSFEFIATADDVRSVRDFMGKLPGLLKGTVPFISVD